MDFCINVTLNRQRAITAFFCGAPLAAHDAGCKVSRDIAMVPCEHAFPIVVTTNSGYPLDQNLYQAVKGMSAAAKISCIQTQPGNDRKGVSVPRIDRHPPSTAPFAVAH